MKLIKISIAFFISSVIAFSCSAKKKDMSMEDFIKIDIEIAGSDEKPETKSVITKKYGYTFEQYDEFAKKVENDPKLKEKRGEVHLNHQKKSGSK